jgi:hypothetical protein
MKLSLVITNNDQEIKRLESDNKYIASYDETQIALEVIRMLRLTLKEDESGMERLNWSILKDAYLANGER